MNANFNTSFAGSNRKYVVGQGKFVGYNLHMQFAGSQGNRDYGFAEDTSLIKRGSFMGTNNKKSLTGSAASYFTLQAAPSGDGNVHVQIQGVNGNRNYGFSLDTYSPKLAEWLQLQLDTPVKATFDKYSVPVVAEDEGDEDEDSGIDEGLVKTYLSQIELAVANIKKELGL